MGLFGFMKNKKEDTGESAVSGPERQEPQSTSYITLEQSGAVSKDTVSQGTEPEERTIDESTGSTSVPAADDNDQRVEERVAREDNAHTVPEEHAGHVSQAPKPYEEKVPIDHVAGNTKVVAIINQKGGVGKSTTAINLAAALGGLGKSVLVVDLDPQGNATSGFGIDKGQVACDTYDLLLGEVEVEKAIAADVCKGVDLIPATINLAGAEVELVSEMARENRLKNAIGALRGKYDYVFIDCPPALGLLTVNALVAADKLLIPIQCEFYALEGVTKLLDSMKRVKKALNPSLSIFGVLLTMYDGRTTLSKQVADEVRNYFGESVFDTIIPRTVKLSEAPSFGQPITEYDPSGKGAVSYVELAKEVVQRG